MAILDRDPPPTRKASLWVLMPAFDDWDAVAGTLSALDEVLGSNGLEANVLVVDDGSTVRRMPDRSPAGTALRSVDVVHLRRNLGHQRAIAVGLCYLVENETGRGILVMDSDGEDLPADIPRLLAASANDHRQPAAFAARLRRSEGIGFTLFYHLYRFVHHALTGIAVRMGNFSYVPWAVASRLVVCAELWSHYAAAAVHSRQPYLLVPCDRGARLTGRSKMTTVALVVHGLSAMAVFADRIGVRALAASAVAFTLAVLLGILVLVGEWGAELTIPAWTPPALWLLTLLATVLMVVSALFTFIVLSSRTLTAVVPLRDYRLFMENVERW